jgi:hypothetical protein
MQIHRQAVAALVILDQAHHCPHGGILDRGAELPGLVPQGAVVTGGIRACQQQLGTGAAFLGAFFQWIPHVTIGIPSGVLTVPERPPLEIASPVNKVFMKI